MNFRKVLCKDFDNNVIFSAPTNRVLVKGLKIDNCFLAFWEKKSQIISE